MREEQLRLLQQLKAGLDSGCNVDAGGIMRSPVSDFTCRDLLAEEQVTFFRNTPLFMGLSVDLPEAGSYWADSETGIPILMVRDDQGRFRAFANTCRHRGSQVVPDGRGSKSRFSCPFHAWTYDNVGVLIAVNREASFGCIDKGQHGLIPLPCAERYGMLWVQPTPGADIDVDHCLSGLQEDMDGWQLPRHVYLGSQVLHANINWKMAIDTFGENYHFDVLHRETLAPVFHANLQTHDVFDLNYRMVFAYKRLSELANAVPDMADWPYRQITLSVYFVFPNTIFLVDPYSVDVLRIFPDQNDPGKSRTSQSFYVVPEAVEHFDGHRGSVDERFAEFNRVIVDEDYHVAEAAQRGVASGTQTHIVFGRNEPALHHYHNAHRRGLGKPELPLEPA